MKLAIAAVLLLAVAGSAAAASNNTVTQWQYLSQEVARQEKLPHQVALRNFALLALATHGSLVRWKVEGFQSKEKAIVAYAGHYILSELYPHLQYQFDLALKSQLNGTRDIDPDVSRARRIAEKAASKILRERANDGSQQFVNFKPAPPNGPVGQYQFTPKQTYAFLPQLGSTKPFVIPSASPFIAQYQAFKLPSAEYNKQLAETQSLGRNGSTTRTQDQGDIANFWAGGAGSKTVAGYWGQIAADLLKSTTLQSERETAKFFAHFFTAAYDTNIAVFQLKYTRKFWRPITAINQGDGINKADPTWTPFLSTPPHPEYPSGHQATSGAASSILRRYNGGDSIKVTVRTDYPSAAAPLPSRSYTSIKDIANEVGDSRIYAGAHFRKSNEDSVAIGDAIAGYVVANFDKVYTPRSFYP